MLKNSHLNNVAFVDVDELGSVLQHGENRSLDVDYPNGFVLLGAQRIDGTILPRE